MVQVDVSSMKKTLVNCTTYFVKVWQDWVTMKGSTVYTSPVLGPYPSNTFLFMYLSNDFHVKLTMMICSHICTSSLYLCSEAQNWRR